MEYVIREKKPGENLFVIEYYDWEIDNTCYSSFKFEDEKTAESYGRQYYDDDVSCATSFRRVVLENGKEAPKDMTIFENANRPGDIYIVPQELAKKFDEYLSGEGAALYKTKTRWFPKSYSFCLVTEGDPDEYCPFNFEWDDE